MKDQRSTSTDSTSQHNCVISVADDFLNLKMKPDFSIVCLKMKPTPTTVSFEKNKTECLIRIKTC